MTADELKAKIDLEGDRKDFTYKEHECRVLRMPITCLLYTSSSCRER